MADPANESLSDLVAMFQERIKQLRTAGDLGPLLATANLAVDEIERRVANEHWDNNEPWNTAERQALTAAQRFAFNAAADCWPGWSVPIQPARNLQAAKALAQRSLGNVNKLALGPLREGTGIWLCGAFDLALGNYTDASSAFSVARQHYLNAKAPGLALLMEGYLAIVRQLAENQVPEAGEDLHQVCSRIAQGAFEDGAEWIEQLQMAQKVFAS